MALPVKTYHRRVLTASAMKVDPTDTESRRRRNEEWQKSAFHFSKTIPELNYASRFYSKMLSRIRLYPALRDSNDQVDEIKSGPPVDLLDRIQDPSGGRSAILKSYGRQMFIAGEGYLFGRELETPRERWSFVSIYELEMDKNKIVWKPTEGGSPREFAFPSQAVAYRMWSPDPERSGEAESPMMAVMEIAEELSALTKAVRATAVSRILNGILKIPAEMSFGSDEPGLDDDPEENKFLADLIDHITGAIENAGTPEAASPFIAEGAADLLAALEWMRMHDPATDYMEQGLRTEAVQRLSVGLDMPPEILKGLADANHWGARQILHETWRSHGAPVAEQFCDDLAESYLRPALAEQGYADWDKVVVGFDDANAVVSPDRTHDADQAWDRGEVSDDGYLTLKGIDLALKPSEVERRIWLAVKLRNVALLKGTPFEVETPAVQPGFPGRPQSADQPLPAEETPPTPGPSGVSRQESQSLAIRGAAEFALLRCREVAGARIRTRYRENTVVAAQINGRSNAFVAAILGQDQLVELDAPESLALVKGGTESFITLCLEWGVEETQAKAIAQMIEVYAARTLFERRLPSFPSGFAAQIERANEISFARREEVVNHNNLALARLSGLMGGDPVAVQAG